jgi:hypothetical protein
MAKRPTIIDFWAWIFSSMARLKTIATSRAAKR